MLKIENYIFPIENIKYIKYDKEENCIEVFLHKEDIPIRFYHLSKEYFDSILEKVGDE